jgi:hypothetical protein
MSEDENIKYMRNALEYAEVKRDVRNDIDKDKYMDEALCRTFGQIMEEKLKIKREEGRGGWWDAEECSIEYLKELLREHIDKGDMVDVANFAAMIYARECMEHPNPNTNRRM